MMFRKVVFALAVVGSMLILAACASKGPEKISVTTTEFKFDPTSWTVSAGKEVEIDHCPE